MKSHPQIQLVRLAAICLLIGILGTSAWTQTQATYFSYRMQQLKQELNITSAQERELKHVVEQETAELMQIACNPATSREYKLNAFRGILKNSESSMRSLLTAGQYQQLVDLRQKIMQELKNRKPEHSCTMAYWGRTTQ